jgi:hypothetical protein
VSRVSGPSDLRPPGRQLDDIMGTIVRYEEPGTDGWFLELNLERRSVLSKFSVLSVGHPVPPLVWAAVVAAAIRDGHVDVRRPP